MNPARPTTPWAIRLLGGASAILFLGLVARFWHPVYGFTAFLQLDAAYEAKAIAAFHEQPVYVFPDPGPYDGLSYAQIAYHPRLDAPELRPAIDNLSYRARRILPPALAWILAAGNPAYIVQAYVALNLAAWLILAALLWRILAVDDGRSWVAWAGILFSAGALGSVREALTDLIALTILVAGLFALERGRRRSALGWFAAAALSRETSLVALPGLCTRPWISWANARRVALAAAPLALWMLYVRWQVGPASQGWGNFNLIPATGFLEKWRAALAIPAENPDAALLEWTTLAATLGLTAQAAYLLLRPRWEDPWWRIGAAYVALLLFLGQAVWEGYPGAAQRVLLPMSVAFFVLARRRRASWAWLLAGCLGVAAGFVYLRDIPPFPRDVAEFRHGQDACIVRVADGWHGVEPAHGHRWAWSEGPGHLDIQAWPRAARDWRLEFSTRSLVPRTVVIREDGRELWRGPVGPALTPVTLVFRAEGGGARLDFDTDAPAVPESPAPGARRLAFELYDARLALTNTP